MKSKSRKSLQTKSIDSKSEEEIEKNNGSAKSKLT